MPIMIGADRESAWRDVLRLLCEVTRLEVGFWKFDFAVSETLSRLR